MIIGIVLAAGRSSRMGSPKALLQLDGTTFLRRIVESLRSGGCDDVVVVLGSQESAASTSEVQREAMSLGTIIAINPDPDSDQVDSLRAGLRCIPPETTAVLSSPVDAPGITAEIVRHIIQSSAAAGVDIVIPAFGARRGHPVLFSAAVFEELSSDDLPEGARSVIHRDEKRVLELPVETSSVLMDIDTPEDYERLLSQR